LLVGLGIFALLQLWYLHKALILADPTLVCPCKSRSPASFIIEHVLIMLLYSCVLFLQLVFDRQRNGLL
jgi:hypothetical protein